MDGVEVGEEGQVDRGSGHRAEGGRRERVLIDPVNRVEGGLMGETQDGGLAEYCRAKAHQLIKIPDNVSFEQAAALPVAYGTAIRMMNTIGQIKPDEKVLILGASGGVGVCCVQLAKLAGAHVIACAGSAEKGRRLTELGADEIILSSTVKEVLAVVSLDGKPVGDGKPGPLSRRLYALYQDAKAQSR